MEKRDKPEWSLTRIHDLAAQKAISYGGSRVQRHIVDWDYSMESVCECLSSLEAEHFQHAVRYSETESWLDVYLIDYRSPTGRIDRLYVKLKLNRDCVLIILCSFHPEGAL